MPELLTMQDLANGHLDIKALGEAANGDENTVVTTRTGNTYPSAERAINIMFQNGGLPAAPFATKALMTASALVDGKYAVVTDDTANNGLYVKTAGAWVKSGYDPLTQSVTYTEDRFNREISPYLSRTNSKNIAVLADVNGNSVLRVDENGLMYIHNLQESLQDTLHKHISSDDLNVNALPVTNAKKNIAAITDSQGLSVMTIKGNGDAYFYGVDKSIQAIAKDLESGKGGKSNIDAEYSKTSRKFNDKKPFVATFNTLMQTARNRYKNVSPVPNYEAQQDYDIGTAWINQLTLTTNNPADRVVIDGYDPQYRTDIGVVHPYVISFDERVAGYKYWMAITPYTAGNINIEIPFMYGTNNPLLRDWVLIEGFPTPFEADPVDEDGANRAHLSDPAITYDPINGDLIYIWRKNLYYESGNPKIGLNARSFDGESWSDIFTLFSLQTEDNMVLSPSILYNPTDNLFYMYTLNMSGNLYYRTTSDIRSDNWSEKILCNIQGWAKPAGWHAELKFIGKQVVLFLHSDEQQGMKMTPAIDGFYFGVSSDFKNFTISSQSIVTNPSPSLYKASFLPVFTSDNSAKFRIVYTTDQQGALPWYLLHVTDTNTINLGV